MVIQDESCNPVLLEKVNRQQQQQMKYISISPCLIFLWYKRPIYPCKPAAVSFWSQIMAVGYVQKSIHTAFTSSNCAHGRDPPHLQLADLLSIFCRRILLEPTFCSCMVWVKWRTFAITQISIIVTYDLLCAFGPNPIPFLLCWCSCATRALTAYCQGILPRSPLGKGTFALLPGSKPLEWV